MSKYILFLSLFFMYSCSSKSSKKQNGKKYESAKKQEGPSDIAGSPIKLIDNVEPIKNEVILPFENSGGVKMVRIKINEVPLDFVFDTGASLISISETEANLLIKQGTLTEEDVLGLANFQDAQGEISESLIVNLKEVEIQGHILRNVKASIVPNAEAPLLLGQSVLEKFGTVTIDNTNNTIILK